jgi:microcystin-dependent protein
MIVCNGANGVASYLETVTVPSSFASGTQMLFVQSSAPTGWTKVTTYNDAALRVVSGTTGSGGATAFSTIFAAGGYTTNAISLSTAQMPSHSHSISPNNNINYSRGMFDPTGLAFQTNEVGGPTFSIGSAGSSDTHYHTTTMQLKYVDTIIATKD